ITSGHDQPRRQRHPNQASPGPYPSDPGRPCRTTVSPIPTGPTLAPTHLILVQAAQASMPSQPGQPWPLDDRLWARPAQASPPSHRAPAGTPFTLVRSAQASRPSMKSLRGCRVQR
ncbi:hypothetical protein EYB53_025230, partial [Candidatus Chloroploca sp. M-50]